MDTLNPTDPNLKPKTPSSEAQNAKAQTQPAEGENLLFFNVMPKDKNQGSMVSPSLKLDPASEPGSEKNPAVAKQKSSPGFWQKYKRYILIGGGVVLLGVGIYFGTSLIGGLFYKSSNTTLYQPKTLHPAGQKSGQSGLAGITTPQAWRDKYFPGCTDLSVCGDNADPDLDGLVNLDEYKLGTDPNNHDSDNDGLADGDEVHVFGTNPLSSHSANNPKFSDSNYLKGGFSLSTGKLLSLNERSALSAKMKIFGLHQPTLTTLGPILNSVYNFTLQSSSSSPTLTSTNASSSNANIDQSLEAKQGRDTQRSNTILNLEIALTDYKKDNQIYPVTSNLSDMYNNVKPYLKVATDQNDPINKDPYLYTYTSIDGTDFTLSFYSEVAGQIIKKNAAAAAKDAASEQASIYDNQRQMDLEDLRTSLLLYSQNNVAGSQTYVFPSSTKYKTALVPTYISQIPKDPKTGSDYGYEVSKTFNTFTLKTPLDAPQAGTTGYMCNQDGCQNY